MTRGGKLYTTDPMYAEGASEFDKALHDAVHAIPSAVLDRIHREGLWITYTVPHRGKNCLVRVQLNAREVKNDD